jgi:hypothetical protein
MVDDDGCDMAESKDGLQRQRWCSIVRCSFNFDINFEDLDFDMLACGAQDALSTVLVDDDSRDMACGALQDAAAG